MFVVMSHEKGEIFAHSYRSLVMVVGYYRKDREVYTTLFGKHFFQLMKEEEGTVTRTCQ